MTREWRGAYFSTRLHEAKDVMRAEQEAGHDVFLKELDNDTPWAALGYNWAVEPKEEM